jgi:hypothetical protein
MTLLVAASNARARRLYVRAGFESAATFLAAGTFEPRRLALSGRLAPASNQ